MAALTIKLFGGFEARLESGEPLRLPLKKARALLAYLAVTPGRAHSRDQLTALLWSESPDRQGRHSLRQALFSLRRALLAAPALTEILIEGESVTLNHAALEVDVVTFERLAAEATVEALERALALHGGDLLAGLVFGEPAFEEWLIGERERLRDLAIQGAAQLVSLHTRAGAVEPAIRAAVRLLGLDALQEPTHRALMRLYVREGRRAAALRQYQVCVDVLRRELGAEPDAETRQLYHEILAPAPAAGPAAPPSSPAPIIARSTEAAAPPRPDALPLVGRAAELERLTEAMEGVAAGRGRLAVVLGEAGVGKSRLTEEVVAEAQRRSWRVLLGRGFELERILPLAPWIEALRTGVGPADAVALRALHPTWREHLARVLPDLWPDAWEAEPAPRPPDGGFHGLFEALTHLVRLLATPQPLLVVLEDLHWADEMSLQLLAFLARRTGASPVMLLATAREEELDEAAARALRTGGSADGAVEIPLARLSRPATMELLRAMSGARPLARGSAAAQVWTLSEGNAFMAVETIRELQERGPADPSDALPLPRRVRDVVARRLERLGEEARRVVAVAAVIGREFEFGLLRAAAALPPSAVARGVEELVRRRLLHAHGERFEFTHDTVRAAVYETLLAPTRAALHLAVGEALEAAGGADASPLSDQLADHFARARHPRRAVTYLARAAAVAARRYAIDDAIRRLEDALGHVAALPEAERDRRRLELLLQLAVALSMVGRFPEILERLAPERERAAGLGDHALAAAYHFRVGLTESVLGRQERAEAAAHLALEAARAAGDDASVGKAHYVLAAKGFSTGRGGEGVAHGREAVTHLERAGEQHWLAHASWILGLCEGLRGAFEAGLEAEERVAAIGRAIGDPGLEATAAWSAAWLHGLRGDGKRALAAARLSLERAPDRANRTMALAVLGVAHLELGAPAIAVPALARAVQRLGSFGARRAVVGVALGEAHLAAGDLAAARAVAEDTRALAAGMGFAWGVAAATRTLGRAAHAAGAPRDAERLLDDAERAFAALDSRFEAACTAVDRAALAHARGEGATAGAALDAAISTIRAAGAAERAARAEAVVAAWARPASER